MKGTEGFQQIVLGGVGGQGVLFITKILARVAMEKGQPVLVSETHGMAQRGGIVVSHLKVGDFKSPLIRPGTADVLLSFHPESVLNHSHFLKEDGKVVANDEGGEEFSINATGLAIEMGSPIAANLILLGYALSKKVLFCDLEEVEEYLRTEVKRNIETNVKALKLGFERGIAR